MKNLPSLAWFVECPVATYSTVDCAQGLSTVVFQFLQLSFHLSFFSHQVIFASPKETPKE